MIPARNRIPAAPIVNEVRRRIDNLTLPGIGVWDAKPGALADDDPRDSTTVYMFDRTTEEERFVLKLEQRMTRALKRGWIDMYQADEICCDVLGMHPVEIYGTEWFEYGIEKEEEADAA